jgi:hypothetical protein
LGVISFGAAALRSGWVALLVLVAGLAVFAAVALHPVADWTPLEYGLTYTVLRYDQALPLAGLGFAIAQMRGLPRLLGFALLALGVGLGAVLASVIVAAISAGANVIRYLFILAPACAVTTGAALVAPRPLRAWLVPVAALLSGVILGLVINISDPTVEEHAFAVGAVLSGGWLVAVAFLLWRQFEQPWFAIAGRIVGSWLIAIGVMLVALHLLRAG